MLQKSDVWFEKAELACEFGSHKELLKLIRQLIADHPQLTNNCDAQINWRVFQDGVLPLWEHPENVNGGKWAMSFTRRESQNPLHKLAKLFGAIEKGALGDEVRDVTGLVLSIKNWGCRLSVWVRNVPATPLEEQAGTDRFLKLMRPKYMSFHSHSGLGERRHKQIAPPLAAATTVAAEPAAEEAADESPERADATPSPAAVPIAAKIADISRESIAGMWVEKSALHSSYAEDDAFEVDAC
jgi:hypothetical protein